MNESPARAVWRFLRREGSVYVFGQTVARWDRPRLPLDKGPMPPLVARLREQCITGSDGCVCDEGRAVVTTTDDEFGIALDPCEHASATGTDSAPDGPDKRWRCDGCGAEWTDGGAS